MATATASETIAKPCFDIKGTRFTLIVLELFEYDYDTLNAQLAARVKAAPELFNQTPVILSLEKIRNNDYIDFIELTELCKAHGVIPIAVRGGSEEHHLSMTVAGLPRLPTITSTSLAEKGKAPEPAPVAEPEQPLSRPTKVITTPIRSGQQIYAAGGDLIVLAPVSVGAEILADGNIHVYSSLRGRALAGVRGNTEARIFCQSLEAELISIAGNYKLHDDLQGPFWKQAAHIELQGEHLILHKL